MNLFFKGANPELDKGIDILSGVLGFKLAKDGYCTYQSFASQQMDILIFPNVLSLTQMF